MIFKCVAHGGLVVLDLRLPGIDGMECLRIIKERWPQTVVVMMTAHGDIESAVGAMRLGAYNYLTKPFEFAEVLAQHGPTDFVGREHDQADATVLAVVDVGDDGVVVVLDASDELGVREPLALAALALSHLTIVGWGWKEHAGLLNRLSSCRRGPSLFNSPYGSLWLWSASNAPDESLSPWACI